MSEPTMRPVSDATTAPREAGRVYFYCFPEKPPSDSSYQHSLVALAEGLDSLGVEVHANIDYWRTRPDGDAFLFRHTPGIGPNDCDVVVLEHIWFVHGNTFPPDLFAADRRYRTVYIDRDDGRGKGKRTLAWDPAFGRFDLILKTHYNSRCTYPPNVRPWAYGLTRRILREAESTAGRLEPGAPRRRRSLIVNFRVHHKLRRRVRAELYPRIERVLPLDERIDGTAAPPTDPYHRLHWMQTGMRHDPRYYQRLNESLACACFGGSFIPNWPRDAFAPVRPWHQMLNELSRRPERLLQWDSWRLWEAFAFGCTVFHVDLEKYGARLPVMPENWRHYIGLDLDDPDAAVRRIAEDPGLLARAARAGRDWALTHYAPEPTARRLLDALGLRPPATPSPSPAEADTRTAASARDRTPSR